MSYSSLIFESCPNKVDKIDLNFNQNLIRYYFCVQNMMINKILMLIKIKSK